VQKGLQKVVAKKGIGIEVNPSSNYHIGTFKRYDNHPMLNLYNRYLTESAEELKNCQQLQICINTDDQGVFGTSLENEYALMARALEKVKDANGEYKYKNTMIYDWLDKIRDMGIRMSFISQREEND